MQRWDAALGLEWPTTGGVEGTTGLPRYASYGHESIYDDASSDKSDIDKSYGDEGSGLVSIWTTPGSLRLSILILWRDVVKKGDMFLRASSQLTGFFSGLNRLTSSINTESMKLSTVKFSQYMNMKSMNLNTNVMNFLFHKRAFCYILRYKHFFLCLFKIRLKVLYFDGLLYCKDCQSLSCCCCFKAFFPPPKRTSYFYSASGDRCLISLLACGWASFSNSLTLASC